MSYHLYDAHSGADLGQATTAQVVAGLGAGVGRVFYTYTTIDGSHPLPAGTNWASFPSAVSARYIDTPDQER